QPKSVIGQRARHVTQSKSEEKVAAVRRMRRKRRTRRVYLQTSGFRLSTVRHFPGRDVPGRDAFDTGRRQRFSSMILATSVGAAIEWIFLASTFPSGPTMQRVDGEPR